MQIRSRTPFLVNCLCVVAPFRSHFIGDGALIDCCILGLVVAPHLSQLSDFMSKSCVHCMFIVALFDDIVMYFNCETSRLPAPRTTMDHRRAMWPFEHRRPSSKWIVPSIIYPEV